MTTTKGGGLTYRNDIHMDTVRSSTTVKQGGFQLWERELLDSPEVKRKATVAQLCELSSRFLSKLNSPSSKDFFDYYFQALGYIASRKERRTRFDADTESRKVTKGTPDYAREFKSYCGRERVVLRRRRTKLQLEQFHIIAQVGQGGYGEVFLARKIVSRSLFALGLELNVCQRKRARSVR